MALYARWPQLANVLRPWARHGATAVFALIVVGAFIGQMDNIVQHFADIGPRLVMLNVATMALGIFSAFALGLGRGDRIAIGMECGLQNAALAIFVALSVLGNPILMVPAITYALVMNVTAACYVAWARKPGLRWAAK